jgi:hypothetical protein
MKITCTKPCFTAGSISLFTAACAGAEGALIRRLSACYQLTPKGFFDGPAQIWPSFFFISFFFCKFKNIWRK